MTDGNGIITMREKVTKTQELVWRNVGRTIDAIDYDDWDGLEILFLLYQRKKTLHFISIIIL